MKLRTAIRLRILIMQTSSRREYCKSEGDRAEIAFFEAMTRYGYFPIKSKPEQDMYEHIDYFVEGIGFDIKANRHWDCIWLELNNVNGKDGWLKGKAKYIVFELVEWNLFCFFKRQDLLDYCQNITEVAKSKHERKKLYTRDGRQDVLVKVSYDDIAKYHVISVAYD